MFFRDFSNLRNARRKLRVARLTAAQGRKAVKRLFHVAAVRLQCRQPVAIAVALHGFEAEPWLLGNRSAGKYPPSMHGMHRAWLSRLTSWICPARKQQHITDRWRDCTAIITCPLFWQSQAR